MNCDSVIKNIPLYFYGELPAEEEDALEQHLDGCVSCSHTADSHRELCAALDRREMAPPAALLAECRHDLMRAVYRNESVLKPVEAKPGSFVDMIASWFPAMGVWRVPVGATAMLTLGFVAARLTAPGGAASGPLSLASMTPDVISSVRSVQPVSTGTQTGEVQIVLDETRRRVVSGQLNDTNIQRLMLAAAHDESNPGVRWESVNLLKNHSDSTQIREVLLNRLLEDPNAGVRLKALDGLKAYAAEPGVRQVLAQVLLRDENDGVRIAAVDALTAHAGDDMVGVLQSVVQKETQGYVRRCCESTLKDLNASVGTF